MGIKRDFILGRVPYLLQIFDVCPGVAAVRVGAVDALRAKVVQLLEVSVHHDLLLVRVLERLAARDHGAALLALLRGLPGPRGDGRAALQPSDVPAQDVHDDGLGDVVRVVPRHDLGHAELHRPAVQRLAPEHPAEGAVVLEPHLGDDLVHGPAVQVLVGEDLQRNLVLVSVPLHGLQTVVPVAGDALVNGQQNQLQLVVVPVAGELVREDSW